MFCIPGISSNDILIALDIEGFDVSTGLHVLEELNPVEL